MSNEIYPGNTAPQQTYTPTVPDRPPAQAEPFAPDVRPRQRRGGRLLAILGVIVILLAGLIAAAVFILPRTAQGGAALAAQGFCDAVTKQDYAKTYTYFGPPVQQLIPQNAYVDIAKAIDDRQGKATKCALGGVTTSKDGKTATVTGTITRSAGNTSVGLVFMQYGSTWKLAQTPDLALLPLTTTYVFCRDLQFQQYDDAFKQLSADFQKSVGSAKNLGQLLGPVQQLVGPLTDCSAQGFQLGTDKVSGTVPGAIDFQKIQNVPTQVSVIATSDGSWKISGLTIDVVGNPVTLPIGGTGTTG